MEEIHLDRTHSASLNMAVLQRFDGGIVEIVTTASHVAIYVYNGAEWVKKNIEGALFVVKRCVARGRGAWGRGGGGGQTSREGGGGVCVSEPRGAREW